VLRRNTSELQLQTANLFYHHWQPFTIPKWVPGAWRQTTVSRPMRAQLHWLILTVRLTPSALMTSLRQLVQTAWLASVSFNHANNSFRIYQLQA
jgi:hypothetical protein